MNARVLRRMTRALAHRGPDGEGFWTNEQVGFGHRRLAIRDLSSAGDQPFISADGRYVVVFNGEIYNDRALKQRLTRETGITFFTDCDTELIAPALAHWGDEALLLFQGMFTIAMWDKAEHSLTLARDPIGIKPLYIFQNTSGIAFASEIKGLLPFLTKVELDPRGLRPFLAQGYPGSDKSLVKGIEPLQPGTVVRFRANGQTSTKYWAPNRTGSRTSFNAALEEFEPLFEQVVKDHLISDVPVGLLLSGGIDSSLIAGSLKGSNDVRAFTAKFRQASFDESDIAASVARSTGLDHCKVEVEEQESLEDRFIRVANLVDGQLADSSAIAFYTVCREARRHVAVVLTGDGADEFFAGYETYQASRMASVITKILPSGLFSAPANLLLRFTAREEERVTALEKIQRFAQGIHIDPDFPHAQWRRYLRPDQEPALFSNSADLERSDALASYADASSDNTDVVDQCLIADQSYYLPGDMLLKADLMSMAHGLEVRVPFLDRRIMEFAGSLDRRMLTTLFGKQKRILREALESAQLMPNLSELPKKGFNVPVARLLRHELNSLGHRLLDKDADILSPHLKPDGVRQLWRRHQEGQENNGYSLWALLTLATWRDPGLVSL